VFEGNRLKEVQIVLEIITCAEKQQHGPEGTALVERLIKLLGRCPLLSLLGASPAPVI
jgi:hypothetical protein